MRTFLATPQLFVQTENYLLCKRSDDSSLRSASFTLQQVAGLILRWRFQPAFDVQHGPLFFGVFLYRPHHQIVIEIVEGHHDTLPIISTFPNA